MAGRPRSGDPGGRGRGARHQQRTRGPRGPARRPGRGRHRHGPRGPLEGGVPVVAYNAAFDLTLLAAELRRHALPSLRERLGGLDPAPVIDPYTIDRSVDRYRRGKRNLEAVCREYGVRLDAAHDATADALAAARLACAIADRHPKVAALGPADLHRRQIEWYAEWAADFQSFLRRKGDATAVVDGTWPLRESAGEPADERV